MIHMVKRNAILECIKRNRPPLHPERGETSVYIPDHSHSRKLHYTGTGAETGNLDEQGNSGPV